MHFPSLSFVLYDPPISSSPTWPPAQCLRKSQSRSPTSRHFCILLKAKYNQVATLRHQHILICYAIRQLEHSSPPPQNPVTETQPINTVQPATDTQTHTHTHPHTPDFAQQLAKLRQCPSGQPSPEQRHNRTHSSPSPPWPVMNQPPNRGWWG